MRRSEVNRDPERARKRAMSDAKCAWRKMDTAQRAEFMAWVESERKPETYTVRYNHGAAILGPVSEDFARAETCRRCEIAQTVTTLERDSDKAVIGYARNVRGEIRFFEGRP